MDETNVEVKEARNVVNGIVPQNENDIVTGIGFGRGAKTVYEIIRTVPETDEQAQERYNCSLTELIKAGGESRDKIG